MYIAKTIATRSTCDRARIGSVIVRDRRIISTGYNGSPRGLGHCDDIGHLIVDNHCVRAVHAEMNAIIQAACYGTPTRGCVIYTTHFPCINCTKAIINAGIDKVYFCEEYRIDSDAMAMLGDALIPCMKVTPENS